MPWMHVTRRVAGTASADVRASGSSAVIYDARRETLRHFARASQAALCVLGSRGPESEA
jgi:hypothetical protein